MYPQYLGLPTNIHRNSAACVRGDLVKMICGAWLTAVDLSDGKNSHASCEVTFPFPA